MRVEVLGEGDPEYAVVAGLHGDEPCGVEAVERLLERHPAVERPVKLVVANEAALAAGERFLDEDLNRAFPGDPDAESHEGRLAADLLAELSGRRTLDLHATDSSPEPFALVHSTPSADLALARSTGVRRVVDVSYVAGGLISHLDGVSVECGLKGSRAAVENAHAIVENFLAAGGVVDAPSERPEPELYEIYDVVEGGDYRFEAENFRRVEAGEAFARDREVLRAEEPFYPVLMSSDGYDDVLGYKARKVERFDG